MVKILEYHDFLFQTISEGPSSSVVVSGEAAESDDEESGGMMLSRDFPVLQSKAMGELEIQEDYSISIEHAEKPKFES